MSDTYNLQVTFDVTQPEDRVDWAFIGPNGVVPPGHGASNGDYVLASGNQLSLSVIAVNPLHSAASVTITGCHLITKPLLFTAALDSQGRAGTYPYPSPFHGPDETPSQGAVVDFGQSPRFAIQGSQQVPWNSSVIQTCANQGEWELQFFMTAKIETPGREPLVAYRVFRFDPECQIGTGALPPR